jgi:hypothetical protein
MSSVTLAIRRNQPGKELAMRRRQPSKIPAANTGSEKIPPGARRRAFDRPENDEHGPGQSAGPRHAADDPGSPDEEYGAVDSNEPLAEPITDEETDATAFSGRSGGAIGGTPANMRASEGHRSP